MYTCNIQSFKILATFWSWAAQFESYLVENPQRHIFAWCGSYNYLFPKRTGKIFQTLLFFFVHLSNPIVLFCTSFKPYCFFFSYIFQTLLFFFCTSFKPYCSFLYIFQTLLFFFVHLSNPIVLFCTSFKSYCSFFQTLLFFFEHLANPVVLFCTKTSQ